ncbi:MAG: PQQ-dependent sugar dehydrogenase [Methanomassiliicoccus sp.]|nr:PQQ-dependent sugar dehydrogenase [Methanomassiliicoccus sp.]
MVRARIGLEFVAEGFANPVFLTCAPGRNELYIVDQIGKIFVLDYGEGEMPEPFLDISDRIVDLDPGYDERGLLGLTFHPEYRTNGRFFVFYSAPLRDGGPPGWNCTNHLVEYRASPGNPRGVDPGSERSLLTIDKPQMNHNGGHIAFGPDGYLYVPLGDGGGANDRGEGHNPQIGNGQDTMTMLGKILRIDVDGRSEGKEYGIPSDNPFVDGGGLPEIYAYGLRNPYHIAFDAEGEHQLFAGDAGQVRWEEVDIIEKGGNYGWNIKEGRHYFDPQDNKADIVVTEPVPVRLIDPIVDYPNLANRTGGIGSVVIGGYVYRGDKIPFLRGRYVFGDFSGTSGKPDGRIYIASPSEDGAGKWVMDELSVDRKGGKLGEYLLSFGQDNDHEIYVLCSDSEGPEGRSGRVYRIVRAEG